jgi:hypothetical protein
MVCTGSPSNSGPCNPNVWNIKELRALSDDTSSQETLRIIRDWTSNCLEQHEHCIQQSASLLPKRILKITADRIFLQERPNASAPYACLSHCWGSSGPAVKLTAETVGRLREGFVTSDLPKTFRDAVEVCRHLGIYYLWIDALCKAFCKPLLPGRNAAEQLQVSSKTAEKIGKKPLPQWAISMRMRI